MVHCSIAPWWRSGYVFLPHSGLLTTQLSRGLPRAGVLRTALAMSLCHAPGTVAPGSVVSTLLLLGGPVIMPSRVQCMLLALSVIGRTTVLWRFAPLSSSGGRHEVPSGVQNALVVPHSRTLRVVICSRAF